VGQWGCRVWAAQSMHWGDKLPTQDMLSGLEAWRRTGWECLLAAAGGKQVERGIVAHQLTPWPSAMLRRTPCTAGAPACPRRTSSLRGHSSHWLGARVVLWPALSHPPTTCKNLWIRLEGVHPAYEPATGLHTCQHFKVCKESASVSMHATN